MLRNFFAREELARYEAGQTLTEYALLLALIAVVCVAAVTLLGTTIAGILSGIAGQL